MWTVHVLPPCIVYPACAGIDLHAIMEPNKGTGLPRMRGDRPQKPVGPGKQSLFTPHARGSTVLYHFERKIFPVYPACAGIDLQHTPLQRPMLSLPRMRGDRPPLADMIGDEIKFTPHARGSTFFAPVNLSAQPVYPACAGIDPHPALPAFLFGGLPRMRGDRPLDIPRRKSKN